MHIIVHKLGQILRIMYIIVHKLGQTGPFNSTSL